MEIAARVRECSVPDTLKAFYVRFVRLNGILFAMTRYSSHPWLIEYVTFKPDFGLNIIFHSLETFGELFASVNNDLQILLSSGPMEDFNFGSDAAENTLAIVRLIAILIFTVHNVNKEPETQSYAKIVQRRVLLQSAFTAAFDFVEWILKRCAEVRDIVSSSYLPVILVYIEWLVSHIPIQSWLLIQR
jgi:protein SMG7